jgi:HD-GYP domain-containing protein (c-di-GMP phosphodiesterase class II)
MDSMLSRIEKLNEIGIALSGEEEVGRILERILTGAKTLTRADGGTLYLLDNEHQELHFELIYNDTLEIGIDGAGRAQFRFPPIPLLVDGLPNESAVVTYSVLNDKTINIPDIYAAAEYDFSGAKEFDEKTGYRTQSLLTVPMKNHEHDVIGVLQLVNARDSADARIRPFSELDEQLAESLASQAAVALTQKRLISDLRHLFESFIRLIANAIDAKSPYTGGHCRRVPVLTLMLADAVHRVDYGPMAYFRMNDADRYELEIAGWLHDCGKVTTPEYVVDKATKLETIFDRVELVQTRLEVLRRDAEIAALRRRLTALEADDEQTGLDEQYRREFETLAMDRDFLQRANIGSEQMHEPDRERINELAQRTWLDMDGRRRPLLNAEEAYNLRIPKGTLTPEEREIINHHIVATIRMLESLPFPKQLKNVPEYAAGHHERMDGEGYPRGLTREQMSIPARIMAIADIFEALSAQDRPYKRGKPLSECLRIMGQMKADNHIDSDLFDIFVRERVYLDYAHRFLDPEQIDEIDENGVTGPGETQGVA